MRINDRNAAGPEATPAGHTSETQKAGQNAGRTGTTGSPETGDRVELSSTLGRLSQAIATHSAQRSSRVQTLSADYQGGRYQPNSEATSKGMIAEALSAGSR